MNQIDLIRHQVDLNNSYNSTLTPCNEDIANNILFFVDPMHNIKVSALVCTAWKNTVQTQLISNKKEEIRTQMHGFLSMTCRKLEDCCPIFQELFASRNERSAASIYKILKNLTERYFGSVQGCCFSEQLCLATWLYQEVDPSRFDKFEKPVDQLVEEMKITAQEKQVEIIEKNQFFINSSTYPGIRRAHQYPCRVINLVYFPIELFNMKEELMKIELKLVNTEDVNYYTVDSSKARTIKSVNCCFPLEGRLIKFKLEISCEYAPGYIDEFGLTISNNQTLNDHIITVNNNMSPAICYNPSIDASAPITLASIEKKIEASEKSKK